MRKKRIIVPRFRKELGFETTPELSNLMRKIKGKHTSIEILLRKSLWHNGVRYRINVKNLPGKPDILISKHKIAIFIDGDFWHGFNWEEKKKKLKSNRGYWIPKIERNMQRDIENTTKLLEMGFTVLRFWENELNKNLLSCIHRVKQEIECLK